MEIRTSYAVEKVQRAEGEKEVLQRLASPDVELRRNASEELLQLQWSGSPGPRSSTMQQLLKAVLDKDHVVRHNVGFLLRRLCGKYRWHMDYWVSRLARRIEKGTKDRLTTQIYVMKALGHLGPYGSPYSKNLLPYFDHEEEYVRLVAVDTVGQLVGEIPRHKRSIVRLLREDPSQEVRKLCDAVLKQRGWQEPHWMKIQKPAWRERVIRSKANNNKGTTKGKKSVGKFGKIYWEKVGHKSRMK